MLNKILVVDDESQNLQLLRIFLHSLNYEVSEAASGKEVFEKYDPSIFDVILLDIMLPDMTGFKVLEKIKKTSETPVIFISALAKEEDRVKGIQQGSFEYLTKPFDFTLLANTIMKAITK